MLLVVDAGNTNVKLGLFSGQELREQWRLRMDPERSSDEYVSLLSPLFDRAHLPPGDVSAVVVACVVPRAAPHIDRACRDIFGVVPVFVSGQTSLGLTIAYEPPDSVGADRLADAVAAVHGHGAPCLVIDFGTATTFNAIAAPTVPGHTPVYLGGAICLGIGVSLEALYARAAKISPVTIARPPRSIGGNTTHALQSGIVHGYAAMVDGMVTRFRREMDAPHCPVVATGGYAHLIAEETETISLVEPELTLIGLRVIHERLSGV